LIGRSGMSWMKREGDGKSPAGHFSLTQILFRRDRIARPQSALATRALRPLEAWCDDPKHRNYNRLIPGPLPGTEEWLWRKDSAYDVIAVIGYNLHPRIRNKGSAIFFHLIREGATHTAGCVAVSRADARKILALCGARTRIVIGK
jgi:L,D-peptidoglycan transpeptidase YkuD (ErfK/YbiS/YcfS/YnhG family)